MVPSVATSRPRARRRRRPSLPAEPDASAWRASRGTIPRAAPGRRRSPRARRRCRSRAAAGGGRRAPPRRNGSQAGSRLLPSPRSGGIRPPIRPSPRAEAAATRTAHAAAATAAALSNLGRRRRGSGITCAPVSRTRSRSDRLGRGGSTANASAAAAKRSSSSSPSQSGHVRQMALERFGLVAVEGVEGERGCLLVHHAYATWGRARTVIARPRPSTTTALNAGRRRIAPPLKSTRAKVLFAVTATRPMAVIATASPTLKARIRTSP